MANIQNEKITGQFGVPFGSFSRSSNLMSPPFKLAGHSFRLHIFPVYDEYIGISMIHLSPTAVDASYSITLKCQNPKITKNRKREEVNELVGSERYTAESDEDESCCWTTEGDYTWVDPDGIVHFTEKDCEDSKWGNEEYILINTLFDPTNGLITGGSGSGANKGGLIATGKVVFIIDLTIHGSDNLLAYKSDNNSNYDTKLIELITDEDCDPYDLMNYVDNDIEGIMKSSSTSNVRNELVKKKQNRLVSIALYNSQYT